VVGLRLGNIVLENNSDILEICHFVQCTSSLVTPRQ